MDDCAALRWLGAVPLLSAILLLLPGGSDSAWLCRNSESSSRAGSLALADLATP
jgi:hypothetical protein